MNATTIHIYTSGDTLPEGLLKENFFHSRKLFELIRQTPRQRPYLITAVTSDGTIVGQLLASVRYRSSLFPPYFYMHCRVLGEGAYRHADGSEAAFYGHAFPLTDTESKLQATLFDQMLKALKEKMGKRILYIEFSNLSHKMFGYRSFRQYDFFPVKWMSIHNSLHSRTPEERISEEVKKHIDNSYSKGVITKTVETEAEFQSFINLLRHHNWSKPRRYIPADEFFHDLLDNPNGRLYITLFHNHVIGCSAVAYSQRQAHLWYSAFRRKSFASLHPAEVTIWQAIKEAQAMSCEHIYFMDVGLPFRKNLYREFILSFGGKPVSTYRWFHCSIGWLNRLLRWIYY